MDISESISYWIPIVDDTAVLTSIPPKRKIIGFRCSGCYNNIDGITKKLRCPTCNSLMVTQQMFKDMKEKVYEQLDKSMDEFSIE